MKISKERQIYWDGPLASDLKGKWCLKASDMSMEYGVFIEVGWELDGEDMTRIYFKVIDHKFDSLQDLRKALEHKAFL